MSDCLFCGIATGEIPAEVVLDDGDVIAFRDIAPQAPVHVLVITRAHFADVGALTHADPALASRLLAAATAVARRGGVQDSGYRIVANTGEQAGQSVPHVHLHVLGGRDLAWPPG